jgi:hypothetical protein
MRSERGQATVEWVGLLVLVGLLLLGLLVAGVRVPAVELARAISSRILCAASLADWCGDQPRLIAAYGTEVGKLVREQMPMLAFEGGSRALPVDFRRCRESACGDGSERGLAHRTDAGLAVTAFVRVVDCRTGVADGANCDGDRAGNLYIQYWLYYADSATLREIPIVGVEGYHPDDWESVQIRIGPDGQVDQRASSHHGYNFGRGVANWGSDAGFAPIAAAAEAVGVREANGWGPKTGILFVSGGSHAGNVAGIPHVDRFTPGRRVHLVPLEPIAATDTTTFAVGPPWQKRVWRDPEADRTD